ncbi:MAG TPA: hypothetical protein VGM56_22760 [Byssovorax sp.]
MSAEGAGPGGAFEGSVVRVRRNLALLALAASPALITPWFPPAPVFALLFVALIARANPMPRTRATQARADDRGLELDGELVPRARLKDGFVVPSLQGTAVLLHRAGVASSILLRVDDVTEGRRMLTALGLDAAQSVARVRGRALPTARGWFHALGFALVPLFFIGIGTHSPDEHGARVALFAALLLFVGIVVASLVPSSLAIGVDGLEVSWFGARRFVRYADVLAVTRFDVGFGNQRTSGVEITLDDGAGNVRVPLGTRSSSDVVILMVLERIREAMEAYMRGGTSIDAARLARNGRAQAAWVRALRGLGAGANASMREAPVDRDALWRIVEDPQATAEARAAAAVAVGGEIDAPGKARLLAVAEGIVAPKLRVAIAAAANDDEDAMRAALIEIEAEEQDARSGDVRRA